MPLSNWNIAEILMTINIIINLFVFMITLIRFRSDDKYHISIKRLLYDIDCKYCH